MQYSYKIGGFTMARKRANGEGSYYQLKDRTWVYQVTVGRKENGSTGSALVFSVPRPCFPFNLGAPK